MFFTQVKIRYNIFNQKIFQSISGAHFRIFSKNVSIVSECSSRDVDRPFEQNNQVFLFTDVGETLEKCLSVQNTCSPNLSSGHLKTYFDSSSKTNFTLSSKINQTYQIATSFFQIPKNCKFFPGFQKFYKFFLVHLKKTFLSIVAESSSPIKTRKMNVLFYFSTENTPNFSPGYCEVTLKNNN